MTTPHDAAPTTKNRSRASKALLLAAVASLAILFVIPKTRDAILDVVKRVPPSPEANCEASFLPFVVGLTLQPPSETLFTFSPPPPAASLAVPQHKLPSQLLLDAVSLTPNPEEPFIVNAFSVGADWIRVVDVGNGTWEFDDLTASVVGDDPGWAILFYVVGQDVYALGWGGTNNVLLTGEWGEDPKLNASWTVDPQQREPLHQLTDFPRATRISAVDFSATAVLDVPAPPASCSWKPEDGSQSSTIDTDAVYFSLAGSAIVYKAEPELKGQDYSWNTTVFLTPAQLGLPTGNYPPKQQPDVDALSYDAQSGELIFSVTESSPNPAELPDSPLYLIREVFPDDVAGVTTPVMLNAPGGQPLSDVIGPRVRGVCKIDPTILTGRRRPL